MATGEGLGPLGCERHQGGRGSRGRQDFGDEGNDRHL